MFLASGVFNYWGQILRSAALQFEDASVVAPFSYSMVVFLFISDILIFNYVFQMTDIIGGVIITAWLLGPEMHTLYNHYKVKESNK